MEKQAKKAPISRRKFLTGAATATAGAATLGFPMIGKSQSPIVLKMQGAWGAKDIFNEMAEEYVKRVNDMSGGRLKIDYLVAGSVVKPFEVLDATSKGVIDGAHTVAVYWYGKSKVASMFGSGPITGCDAAQNLAWISKEGHKYYDQLMKKLGINVVGFFAMPMPTQPLGWFKKPIKSAAELKGLKHRTVGLAADLMQELGCKVTQLPGGEIVPAMERGVIDAFEFNNPTSDSRFGAQDVAKYYMMGSITRRWNSSKSTGTARSTNRCQKICRRCCATPRKLRPLPILLSRWTITRGIWSSSGTRIMCTCCARRRAYSTRK
jgi:TRAP-type mannitol/chloroaromatic compound transport system substrate-binding protein